MENGIVVAGPGSVASRSLGLRASSVIAALALVLAMFVLVQQRADASPVGPSVAAAVVVPAAVAGVAAQIDIRQFICPILIAVRNAFASSPFFSFVAAAINPLLIAFGCGVS